MVTAILAFCSGAAAALAVPVPWPGPLVAALAATGILLLRRQLPLAAFCVAFAWTAFTAAQALANDWPCARDREAVEVTGRVAAPAIARDHRTDFDLDVREPGLPARIRISWYEASAMPMPGERWRLALRLRCRSGLANPGAPDREFDLLRQGIGATAYTIADQPPVRLDDGGRRNAIERLRARIAAGIDALLPGSASGAVLQGLSVGVRGNIPDRLWEAFAETGIAHLMAISGLHVTGCAVFVLALARLAGRLPGLSARPIPPGAEAVIVLAATGAYAWLSGASLPALRTLVMVALVAALRVLRRSLPLPGLLAVAALVLVAADPLALASAGFWLSFAATAALLAVLEAGPGWRARVGAFARTQLAILVLLTPVLALAFGRVSLVSPLANAVAIPVFGAVLLPAILFATAVDSAWQGAGAFVWQALAAVLDAAWPLVESLAAWRFASWAPAAPPALAAATAFLVTLAALVLPGLRRAAVAACLAILCGAGATPVAGGWTLTVVDVGQGLAAVVQTRNRVLVFDTGPAWRGGGSAARVSLLPVLRARGIRHIDRLVVSHPDLDHAGGVVALAAGIGISSMMTAPDPSAAISCRLGDAWRWDGLRFEVLHPRADAVGSDNDRSCAIRVSGAGGAALLLADPESAAERDLRDQPIAADVVLLPHHGSRSSSSPEFVASIGARIGIASAGFGNRWNLPAAEIVARWRTAGTTVLSTAEEGAVTIRFAERPGAIVVEAERRGNRHWWRRGAAGPAARTGGAPARYHAAPCGKSSLPAAPSCGRSCFARSLPPPSSSSASGRCSASA